MNIRILDQAANNDEIELLMQLRLDFLRDDCPQLPQKELDTLGVTLKRYFQDHLGKNFWAAVGEDNGRPAGSAFLTLYERPANSSVPNGVWGEVSNVFTYPEYRKRGLATAMMRRLLELAAERGISRVDLSASAAGRPVYEKLGFTVDSAHTRMQLGTVTWK